jgi:3-methyladenine DNA glycosylase AlkD
VSKSAAEVLGRLRELGDPQAAAGMSHFGINPESALGIKIPVLRGMAKELGKDHELALALWASGVHEARILASMIDDPKLVTEEQLERWAADFNSWDLCDQCCGNLFDRTPFAYEKALEWSSREAEFVKRAGFALMAYLAVHDKKAPDEAFESFYPTIVGQARDERNFVKKAVNWALRQIGKRSRSLNESALAVVAEIEQLDSKAARWIAADARRELTGEKVQARLR